MTMEASARPLGDLIGGLASDITGLFHSEMELAKTEASEKLGSVIGGVELLLAGAVIGIGAIVVLFEGIVTLIAAAFTSNGMGATMANSIATIIVFVVAAIIAWALVARARESLSARNLSLPRTTTALSRDARAIRESL